MYVYVCIYVYIYIYIATLGIQSHCDMIIKGSNHILIMVVTILRR